MAERQFFRISARGVGWSRVEFVWRCRLNYCFHTNNFTNGDVTYNVLLALNLRLPFFQSSNPTYVRTPQMTRFPLKMHSTTLRTSAKGVETANGFLLDNLGYIYMLMPPQNAIYIYKSALRCPMACCLKADSHNSSTTFQAKPYVRGLSIVWPDSANVGFDGCIYFNISQLPYQPDGNNGRQCSGLILRSKLPDVVNRNMTLGLSS